MNRLTNNIKQKLDDMTGCTYLYMGRTVRIKGYDIYNGRVIIFNGGHSITFPAKEADEELEQFLPAADSLVKSDPEIADLFAKRDNHINKMEQVLLDNIKKINQDPAHIDQAKAVQQSAKTMLDIQRFKLDMIKEQRKGGF